MLFGSKATRQEMSKTDEKPIETAEQVDQPDSVSAQQKALNRQFSICAILVVAFMCIGVGIGAYGLQHGVCWVDREHMYTELKCVDGSCHNITRLQTTFLTSYPLASSFVKDDACTYENGKPVCWQYDTKPFNCYYDKYYDKFITGKTYPALYLFIYGCVVLGCVVIWFFISPCYCFNKKKLEQEEARTRRSLNEVLNFNPT
jgi:hypothetical protein